MVHQADRAVAIQQKICIARKKNEAMKEFENLSQLRHILSYLIIPKPYHRVLNKPNELLEAIKRQEQLLAAKLKFDSARNHRESSQLKKYTADAYFALSEFEKASRVYVSLIKTPTPDHELVRLAGTCFYELGNQQLALKYFVDLKRIGERECDTSVEKAALEMLLKIYERAGQVLKRRECEERLDEIGIDEENGEDLESVYFFNITKCRLDILKSDR